MGQALYRKYRSKSLDEVVGQSHITRALKNAIKSGKISHAYLFTGPKGVGKTSIARILAHQLNNFTYDEKQNYIDIIEIDAASNRRIDEIRELRDRVHIAPTSGRYKVYIIDEVHMLTKEAFNALLKTLEEPPEHVIFILATTETHKLPETIISRTQRYNFKPIDETDAIKHLKSIAKLESIIIDDEALKLIIEHAEGSFRDSISLLDQASNISNDVIKLSDVEQMLGVAPTSAILGITTSVGQGSSNEIIEQLTKLLHSGSTPSQISKQLTKALREVLLNETDRTRSSVLSSLMRELIAVPSSHDPSTALQLALLEGAFSLQTEAKTGKATPTPKNTQQPAKAQALAPNVTFQEITNETADTTPEVEESIIVDELWPKVVTEIKKHHNTLYSIARMAKSHVQGTKLTLVFAFPFHEKRLTESKNKQIVLDIIKQLTGEDFTLECQVATKDNTKKTEPSNKTMDVSNISNIFGGAEVLES